MQGNAGTIRLWVYLLGSFLTAWLVALLPGETNSYPTEKRQAFVTSLSELNDGIDQSTCSTILFAHVPAACISSWPGASPSPSLAYLPLPIASCSSAFLCLLNRPSRLSFFSFSFVRQIFRYQIAINAP